MKTIVVKIKGGKATVETSGFHGSTCAEATANLERKLFGKAGDSEKKPEFYEIEVDQNATH